MTVIFRCPSFIYEIDSCKNRIATHIGEQNHVFLQSNADLRGRLLKNALFLNIRLRRVMFILLKIELFVEAKNKVLKKL